MLLVLDLKTQVFLTMKNWIWLETFVSSFLICLSTFQPHKWSFNSHTVLKNSEQAPRYYFACSCFSHCEASLHHGLHNSLSQRNPQKACYLNINWPSCSMLIDILEINLHANAPSDAYIYIYLPASLYVPACLPVSTLAPFASVLGFCCPSTNGWTNSGINMCCTEWPKSWYYLFS